MTPLSKREALRVARLGWQRVKADDVAQGVVLLGDAVRALPNDAEVTGAYGLALARANKPGPAAGWLQRSLAIDGKNLPLWAALGEAAIDAGDFTLAEKALRRCLSFDPEVKHPAGVRARALIKRTQKTLASRS